MVWTFRDVVLDDGGSISGHFTYSPDVSPHVTDWSVWATGGNATNFPIFEYRPDNSTLGEGSGGEIEFYVPGNFRQVIFRPSVPLTGTPVYVPLYLDFPSSSAYESFGGPSPIRLIQSGALFTDPNPTRVRWFIESATFDDGGTLGGYVDESPDGSTILKWAVHAAGGNLQDFPALTYSAANSTPNVFVAPMATQKAREFQVLASPRLLHYAGQAPLRQDGGRVAIDATYAAECLNCSPVRMLVGGTLRGVSDEIAGDGFD